MNSGRIKFFIFIVICAIISWSSAVYAADCGTCSGGFCIPNPIKACGLEQVVKSLVRLLTTISIPLLTLFIMWSGFLFLTARGSDEQLKKAKTVFYWTVVGGAVLVGANVLAEALVNFAKQL